MVCPWSTCPYERAANALAEHFPFYSVLTNAVFPWRMDNICASRYEATSPRYLESVVQTIFVKTHSLYVSRSFLD